MTLRTPHSMSTAQTPWCRRFATCSPGYTSDAPPNWQASVGFVTCGKMGRSDYADVSSEMPLTLLRPDCPGDTAPCSHLNGCHPRPVNGYGCGMAGQVA